MLETSGPITRERLREMVPHTIPDARLDALIEVMRNSDGIDESDDGGMDEVPPAVDEIEDAEARGPDATVIQPNKRRVGDVARSSQATEGDALTGQHQVGLTQLQSQSMPQAAPEYEQPKLIGTLDIAPPKRYK